MDAVDWRYSPPREVKQVSTVMVELPDSWSSLLRTWRELDIPEGWRAEITELGVTLMPPPRVPNGNIADLVHKTLVRADLPDEWAFHQTMGVRIRPLDQLYIPDILVIPRDAPVDAPDEETAGPFFAEDARLVVEITSKGNANHDRKRKLWGYGHGPAPLYLLIDGWHPDGKRCTVYSEPSNGQYLRSVTSPFGEPVELPAPFNLTLDTSQFR